MYLGNICPPRMKNIDDLHPTIKRVSYNNPMNLLPVGIIIPRGDPKPFSENHKIHW